MVDLKTQYDFIKDEINQGMQQVFSSSLFINGPVVKEFQNDLESYLGIKHVIPCANGTDSLQIALMSLKLKPGDEVITSDFAFVSVAEVISILNLKPVLVDINPDTFNIDPLAIEKAITARTKAIIPVHLFGQSADMEQILVLAKKYNLFVIEDNAQAIGANYTFSDGTIAKTGTLSNVSTTSFFPSKNLGAYGDGGAIFTNDEILAEKMVMIANHGQSKRYYHDVVGCNSRLDSIQAAVLKIKLAKLDEYINARRKVASYYDDFLAQFDVMKEDKRIITPVRSNDSRHVFHQYTIRLIGIDRDALHKYLADKDIPSMIYYPVPAHRQKMFSKFGSQHTDLPVTDMLTNQVLSLPIHTEMEQEQLDYISSNIADFIKNNY